MTAVFDSYAAYYDLLYRDKNYSAEANFVDELLAKHGVPDRGTLLELGCGTGKHAAELARKGYGIHGLDVSVSMVQAANDQKPSEIAQLLQFELGDVRTARIGRQFDAVISLFHVASYQVTNADLTAMFQTAAMHLKAGGVFLFDCWYGPGVLTDLPVTRVKRMSGATANVLRIAEPVMHPNENIVDVNYTVQVQQRGEDHVSEIHETHRMRYLFTPELEWILERAGLQMVESVDWLTGTPIGLKSWTATFVAVKLA